MLHLAGPVNPTTGHQFCSICGERLSWLDIPAYLYEWEKANKRKYGIPHTYIPGCMVEKTESFTAYCLKGDPDCIPPLDLEPIPLNQEAF